jgi:predicted acyl esterase
MTTLSTRAMLIEPKLELSGTQLAGWAPQPAPAIASGILFDEDVPITLPDGTVLLADLFRPAGAGPVPALVSWAAYIKDTERLGGGPFIDESGVCPYTIKRGYAVIRIQPRGTGRSGGTAPDDMFGPREVRDCHDAIEWVARQPWCDGSVGMTGMSYFAIAQLLVAATRPRSLKAIFPLKAMTDVYRHGFYKGGAAYSGAIELFAAFEKVKPPKIPAHLRHLLSHFLNRPRFAMETSDPGKSRRNFRNFMRKRPPGRDALDLYVSRMVDRVWDDAEWRRSSVASHIDQIALPVCIATDFGAQGFHFFGAFELWHRLTSEKFLFIGPPEYSFPWSSYQQELIAWYDWTLKGIDNGYAALPKVRYFLRGANEWRAAESWPLPGARAVTLHLGGDGTLNESAAAESTSAWIARSSSDYAVPGFDEHVTQLLRYQTAPLPADVVAVGPVRLSLTLSSCAIDTYVVARLSDIAPDGTRTKLAWGWLRASHRTVDAERSNPTEIVHDHSAAAARQLTPGEPTTLLFSLTPIANLFRAGHRIELELTSRPDLVATASGEGFDMFCWDAVPYWARNHVHHGGAAPSVLDIAVL